VQLNWTERDNFGKTLLSQWGTTRIRVYEIGEGVKNRVQLDIMADTETDITAFTFGNPVPFMQRCGSFENGQRLASEWVTKVFGQCQNRSLEGDGGHCPELATRVNDMWSRYCPACYEKYADNLRSRGIPVKA
jgi:hypothetical protein